MKRFYIHGSSKGYCRRRLVESRFRPHGWRWKGLRRRYSNNFSRIRCVAGWSNRHNGCSLCASRILCFRRCCNNAGQGVQQKFSISYFDILSRTFWPAIKHCEIRGRGIVAHLWCGPSFSVVARREVFSEIRMQNWEMNSHLRLMTDAGWATLECSLEYTGYLTTSVIARNVPSGGPLVASILASVGAVKWFIREFDLLPAGSPTKYNTPYYYNHCIYVS